MSFLVLANPWDETAVRIAVLLRQRHGAAAVQIHTPDELILARWAHRVADTGVETAIRLHGGTFLPDCVGTVIFNRLTTVDLPGFATATPADRDYARMEMFALLLSWLASPQLRVINPASPASLSGAVHRPLVWLDMARRAGLPGLDLTATTSTRRFPPGRGALPRSGSPGAIDPTGLPHGNSFSWFAAPVSDETTSVLVVGGQVLGDVPAPTADACRRLACLSGLDLLQIDLARPVAGPVPFVFTGANACPEIAGQAALSLLATFLEAAAAGTGQALP